MSNSCGKSLRFLRDRWQWVHGRCPRCNRNLYATFPYYLADYPTCPVCKDEIQPDLHRWRTDRAWCPAKNQHRAVAFDVDPASLLSLREAFPKWEIEAVEGATTASLTQDRNLGAADLMIVCARADEAETLDLCRGLRKLARRAGTPLLVLVPPAQPALVREVLKAGADNCLVLPIDAKEVASMLLRAQAGNQPGRHTLDLEKAQTEDSWRDDGGEG